MKYFSLVLGLAYGDDILNTADRDPRDIVRIRVGDISGDELLRRMTIKQPECPTVTDDDVDEYTTPDIPPPVYEVTPVVDAGPRRTTDEGGGVTFLGSLTHADADTYTILWDFGDGSGASGTLTPTHTYTDNGVYTAKLTVRDDDGGEITDTTIVRVKNIVPVVKIGRLAIVSEGGTYAISGTFVDPGDDEWSATVDYGDGSAPEALELSPDKAFDLSHVYVDGGTYRVTVSVTDDDGGVGTAIAVVAGFNVAPVVDAGSDATIEEGATFVGSGSFVDPGDDRWGATVDYGDGSAPESLELSSDKTFDLNHVYVDNGVYTVKVTVWDDDRGTSSDTVTITVTNVAPIVDAGHDENVDGEPDATIKDGEAFVATGSFTDPGADTWTATVDYGDGSGPQNLVLANGTFELNHVYTVPGTYTVTITVIDKDGGIGVDTLTVKVEFTFAGIFN